MRFGSLFAGVGGIDLGLEWAGMTCAWQVEIDEYCLRILNKHWPDVAKYGDVREIELLPYVDLICGGFPCQPVALIGQRKGQNDEEWLWPEFNRIIRMVRPRYIIVENVPGLLSGGMSDVLGDLAESGYDAEWQSLPASCFGAPHRRDRVFIVAYPTGKSSSQAFESGDTIRKSWQAWQDDSYLGWREMATPDWVLPESYITRKIDGIPNRLDRDKALGNAVVPQVAEWIGRRIIEFDELRTNA